MMDTAFFGDLLQTIADRGRALVGLSRGEAGGRRLDLALLCDTLLSGRGEASGVALAREVLTQYGAMTVEERLGFLRGLAANYGPDRARLDAAIKAYQAKPDGRSAIDLHLAAEPRRQELIRRLNLAPGGTASLVRMREEALRNAKAIPGFDAMDADFTHLFSSWFNRGFLVLRRIDWSTPANILQKIIKYEAVHEIRDWDDLRRRLEPPDRRCFAFFHPQLTDDPLIFVEVALTADMASSIAEVLTDKRKPITADQATSAVFYSISNCQEGLRGISFGNFLIKQVVEELSREIPTLRTFVTLSPVPGFANWLKHERQHDTPALAAEERRALTVLDEPHWETDPAKVEAVTPALQSAASHYFLRAKQANGKPLDPVARFHLGNGARLERINTMADLSPKGMRQSHGVMVNYLYDLRHIERNHEAFVGDARIAASSAVRKHLKEPARAPERTRTGSANGES